MSLPHPILYPGYGKHHVPNESVLPLVAALLRTPFAVAHRSVPFGHKHCLACRSLGVLEHREGAVSLGGLEALTGGQVAGVVVAGDQRRVSGLVTTDIP